MEGYLETCLGYRCPTSCCSRGYAESLDDFLRSFRGKNQDRLREVGIDLENRGHMVWYQNCTDGKECKILANFGEVRSIECRIFPYRLNKIQEGESPSIYLKPCPATKPGHSVPEKFTEQVLELVRRHYFDRFGKETNVLIWDPIQEA